MYTSNSAIEQQVSMNSTPETQVVRFSANSAFEGQVVNFVGNSAVEAQI